MEFKEFRRKIINNKVKIHKVSNSYGVYDYYKYYRRNKPKDIKYRLTEGQFYSLIRKVNELLVNELLATSSLQLPFNMGHIDIRKYDSSPKLDGEGKLINNNPIDWDTTFKLWYEDSESYTKKLLIRRESKESFRLIYNRTKAIYKNKSYYHLNFNCNIKQKMYELVKIKKLYGFEFNK